MVDKCKHCKKTSIPSFTCLCTNTYCVKCRMPEKHECINLHNFKINSLKILESKLMSEKITNTSILDKI